MLSAFTAIPLIALTWSLCALVFVGYGRVLLGLMRGVRVADRESPIDLFACFWLGACGFMLAAQCFHCVLPMRGLPLLLLLLPAMLGFSLKQPKVDGRGGGSPWTIAMCIASCLGVTAWVAWRALRQESHTDSIVYQYHAVRWMVEFPLVPGLVNLHERLGFNSSSHLFAATLEGSVWPGSSAHVANGFWPWAILMQGIVATKRLFESNEARISSLLTVVCCVPVVVFCLTSGLSSPTTDPPATCISLAVLILASKVLTSPTGDRSAGDRSTGDRSTWDRSTLLAVVFSTAALAAVTKLNQSVLAVMICIVAAGWVACSGEKLRGRPLATGLFIAAALSASWCVRTIVLTGYPLYPSTLFPLPVDWCPPEDLTGLGGIMIRIDAFGAMHPFSSVASIGQWLRRWVPLQVSPLPFMLSTGPILGSLALGICYVVVSRIKGTRIWNPMLLLCIGCGVSLGFCLLTAPHARFAAAASWGCLGGLVCVFSRIVDRWVLDRVGVAGCWLFMLTLAIVGSHVNRVVPALARGVEFVEPRDSLLGAPPAPATRTFVGPMGLPLYIPTVGAKGVADSQLPGAPNLNRSIVLREPGTLRWGFRHSSAAREGPDRAQIQSCARVLSEFGLPGDVAMLLGPTTLWSHLEAEGAPTLEIRGLRDEPASAESIAQEVISIRKLKRFWIIVSDESPEGRSDMTLASTYFADHSHVRRAQRDERNMSVYLYEAP